MTDSSSHFQCAGVKKPRASLLDIKIVCRFFLQFPPILLATDLRCTTPCHSPPVLFLKNKTKNHAGVRFFRYCSFACTGLPLACSANRDQKRAADLPEPESCMAGCELLCGLCGFRDFNPGLSSPSTLSFKKLNCFKNYFFSCESSGRR